MGTVDHIMNIEMPIVRTETDDNSPCPREAQCRRQVAEEIFGELEEQELLKLDYIEMDTLPSDSVVDLFQRIPTKRYLALKARWLK